MTKNEAIKEAKRAYQRKWKSENREKCNEYHRKWRKKNPEKIKQYNDRYWEKKANEILKSESATKCDTVNKNATELESAIIEMKTINPTLSNREIARRLNTNDNRVRRTINKLIE